MTKIQMVKCVLYKNTDGKDVRTLNLKAFLDTDLAIEVVNRLSANYPENGYELEEMTVDLDKFKGPINTEMLVYLEGGKAFAVEAATIQKYSGSIWPELGEEALIEAEEEAVAEGEYYRVYDKDGEELGLVKA